MTERVSSQFIFNDVTAVGMSFWKRTNGAWQTLSGNWTSAEPVLVHFYAAEKLRGKPFNVCYLLDFVVSASGAIQANEESVRSWWYRKDPRGLTEAQWPDKSKYIVDWEKKLPAMSSGSERSVETTTFTFTNRDGWVREFWAILQPAGSHVRLKRQSSTAGVPSLRLRVNADYNRMELRADLLGTGETDQRWYFAPTPAESMPRILTVRPVVNGTPGSPVLTREFDAAGLEISAEADWFACFDLAGVPRSAKEMQLRVEITDKLPDGASGASSENPFTVRSCAGTVTLKARSDLMSPVIQNISDSPNYASSPTVWAYQEGRYYVEDVYVSGYARAEITVRVARHTLSPIASVWAVFPGGISSALHHVSGQDGTDQATGLSYETWHCVTLRTLTTSGSVTVEATDQRGFRGADYTWVTVAAYRQPTINISLYRCDAQGNEAQEGDTNPANWSYFRINAAVDVLTTGMSGNRLREFTVTAGGQTTALTPGVAITLPLVPGATADINKKYTVTVRARDAVSETKRRSLSLSGSRHDMSLIWTYYGTQLGLGMAPDGSHPSLDRYSTDQIHPRGSSGIQMPDRSDVTINGYSIANFVRGSRRLDGKGALMDSDSTYNLLRVAGDTLYAGCNEIMEVRISKSSFSSWKHLPAPIRSMSGDYFTATRIVMFPGSDGRWSNRCEVVVVLLEKEPVKGRVWLKYGYVKNSGTVDSPDPVVYWTDETQDSRNYRYWYYHTPEICADTNSAGDSGWSSSTSGSSGAGTGGDEVGAGTDAGTEDDDGEAEPAGAQDPA